MTTPKNKPALVIQTNDTPGSCVDCKVDKPVRVTYEIRPVGDKESKSFKGLPFAVAIDGVCLPLYKDKPSRADKSTVKIGPITIKVGQSVSLYLGSDAKADYRNEPLYKVTASNNDILVVVQEKRGLHPNDLDTPVFNQTTAQNVDEYRAPLTGNIWLKFSHRFTSAEVDALIPSAISALAKEAVKKIYDGQFDAGAKTALTIPFNNPLRIIWINSTNVKTHVANYNKRNDIHTRVSPRTYAALIQAAEMAGLNEITHSSGWRPMVGSILHRIGLGLDVRVVKSGQTEEIVNRRTPGVPDPENFAKFRKELAARKSTVRQIFDPWMMDADSTDNTPATPNKLSTPNETLHNDHLHITAVDEALGYESLFTSLINKPKT